MAPRLLVTGARGFVGRSAVPRFAAAGYEVVEVVRGEPVPATGAAAAFRCDLTDGRAVAATVAAARPDAVLHLAGVTYLPEVEANPVPSFAANVLGTLNLLDAVLAHAPSARVLVTSSCSVYGEVSASELPLHESSPLKAVHPYGVQKIGVELVTARARSERGLAATVARPFNHIGPGQDPRISFTHFARQIVAAERGQAEPVLRVGNLSARRDILDVRDVVEAYLALFALPSPPPVVNVCSGTAVGIGEALERLLAMARVACRVATDPSRLRRLDTPELRGDAGLLRRLTGWAPRHPLDTTLARILDHVRAEHGGDAG